MLTVWLWGGELFLDPVAEFESLVVIEPLILHTLAVLVSNKSLCNSSEVALGGSDVPRPVRCSVPL